MKFTNISASTETEVTTSWFINTNLMLDDVQFTPRDNISMRSDKTDGAWDTLLQRVVDTQRFDVLKVTVLSINTAHEFTTHDVVEDPELDALLNQGALATPLFTKKAKVPKAPVFAYINCEVSSEFITGTYKASIAVRSDMPKAVLSKLLKLSKVDIIKIPVVVTQVVNPRVKVEYVLKPLTF